VFDGLLALDVVDGPVPVVVFALAAALLVGLLLHRPSLRWLLRIALAAVVGMLAAVATWLICIRWLNLFGESLGFGN
jgi:hypothetical protein